MFRQSFPLASRYWPSQHRGTYQHHCRDNPSRLHLPPLLASRSEGVRLHLPQARGRPVDRKGDLLQGLAGAGAHVGHLSKVDQGRGTLGGESGHDMRVGLVAAVEEQGPSSGRVVCPSTHARNVAHQDRREAGTERGEVLGTQGGSAQLIEAKPAASSAQRLQD